MLLEWEEGGRADGAEEAMEGDSAERVRE